MNLHFGLPQCTDVINEDWIFTCFTFKLQTQEDNHDCVYYSRKKYQLFKDISQERAQNMAAEIKKYRGDKNLTINGNSSIKKGKVDFEERKIELSYSDISTIMNECPF